MTSTTIDLTATGLNGPGIYEVQNWKPIRAEQYLELLGQIAMTIDHEGLEIGDVGELKSHVSYLPDTRLRFVNWAYLRPTNFEGHDDGISPFLMRLYCQESGSSVYFKRTNVELCLP